MIRDALASRTPVPQFAAKLERSWTEHPTGFAEINGWVISVDAGEAKDYAAFGFKPGQPGAIKLITGQGGFNRSLGYVIGRTKDEAERKSDYTSINSKNVADNRAVIDQARKLFQSLSGVQGWVKEFFTFHTDAILNNRQEGGWLADFRPR